MYRTKIGFRGRIAALGLTISVLAMALLLTTVALAQTVDSPWTGSGSGTTTVVSDGSSAPAEFTYDNSGISASGSWEFKTTAASAGTHDLQWAYTGHHAFYLSKAKLDAFVDRPYGTNVTTVNLVNAGPFRGGFAYSGTQQLTVQAGDVYGFRLSGSHGDATPYLFGTLTVDEVQLDDDGDGVFNNADTCANTPAGETANAAGCSPSQVDDDGDGVFNNADLCANTPAGETVNGVGCSDSQVDDDGDGVFNNADTCANTPAGETPNAVGCSDGIADAVDTAPSIFSNDFSDGTTSGTITSRGDQELTVTDSADSTKGVDVAASTGGGVTPATVSACTGDSTLSLDTGDSFTVTCGSVIVDVITGTVEVTFIAPDGTVTTASLGADNSLTLDTVTFTVRAPASNPDPVATVINSVPITLTPGAAVYTVDTDRDGVNNTIDQCPGSRVRELVNGVGCSIDNDGDRITNDVDVLPNTGSLDASDRTTGLGGITDITIESHGSSQSFSCFIMNGGPEYADLFEVDFDAHVRACVGFGRVHKVSDELPNITNSQFGPRGIRLWITAGDGDGLNDDWVRIRCDSPLCMREWNGRFYPTTYSVPDFHYVVDLIDHDQDPNTPPRKVSRKVSEDLHMVISAGSTRTTVEEGSVEVSVGTGDDIIVFTVTASEGGAAGGLFLDNAEDGTLVAINESEAGAPPITITIDGVEVGSLIRATRLSRSSQST